MGMWIGGDRDGNPFVTAETLKLSATVQSEVIPNYYIEKVDNLLPFILPLITLD